VGNALCLVGAIAVFAFLVWYLTGQTIARWSCLAPATCSTQWCGSGRARRRLSALGRLHWHFAADPERDRFQPADRHDELFVSASSRTAPSPQRSRRLFQLIFIVELVSLAIAQGTRGRAHRRTFCSRSRAGARPSGRSP
jgi:hypothetical protein